MEAQLHSLLDVSVPCDESDSASGESEEDFSHDEVEVVRDAAVIAEPTVDEVDVHIG